MKSCPACTFLVQDEADVCQFCGADTSGAQPDADQSVTAPVAGGGSVSTKVTAGVIVVAALSVLGVGAWALDRAPAPTNDKRTVATAPPKVSYRTITVSDSGPSYHLDVATGATEPDLSNGLRSTYATARELDVARIPVTGPADLPTMLATFASGWPTTDTRTTTTPAGAGLSFSLTNDSTSTQGTLIDAGANGVFLVAVKAPKGSTLTSLDLAVLKRAVATLAMG